MKLNENTKYEWVLQDDSGTVMAYKEEGQDPVFDNENRASKISDISVPTLLKLLDHLKGGNQNYMWMQAILEQAILDISK